MEPMTSDSVHVRKIDDVYAFVECDRAIAHELNDYFSFYAKDFQFTPAYENKLWDGKIRLYEMMLSRIYGGLVPYIKKFCKQRGYHFSEEYTSENPITPQEVANFVLKGLNIHSGGNPITPRDYQLFSVYKALKNKRALILSPTASGKSLVIYSIIRYMSAMSHNTLIVVPTTSLVEQMYTDFEDYSNDQWEVEKYCHRIYSGKEKTLKKRVVISTWQSIYKMPAKWFKRFRCVIGDECHGFKADSLKAIMTKLQNADYRIGCTGTLDDTHVHKLVLEGLFGPVFQVITTKELMDRGEVSQLKIKCIDLQYPKEECKEVLKMKYADEVSYIVGHIKRKDVLKNIILRMEGNTLVLFQRIEHGKTLFNEINTSRKGGTHFVYGGTDTEVREAIRQIVEKESKAILFASYGTFSVGVNIKRIDNIVFYSSYKSKIKILQSIGRGLRMYKDDCSVTLYDVVDNFTMKGNTKQNYGVQHFLKRIELYNNESFDYSIQTINL